MTVTPSTMLPLGTKAPDFTLLDTISGKSMSLMDLKSDIATAVMFICNHCPYVKHIQATLIKLADEYIAKNIAFIAISANDPVNYPEDAPEKMRENAQQLGFSFPYLFDETQEVAKAYHAACTPDFYIFDKNLACVYRGQFDEARPGNQVTVTGHDIKHALDQILNGEQVNPAQKPSMGCNIKWRN